MREKATPDKAKSRVLLVDDFEVVRHGLRALLTDSAIVVGEAGTCREAVDSAVQLKPDIVLLDLRLPDGSGVEVCRDILAGAPNTRVLFLTAHADEGAAAAGLLAGAAGYLLKTISSEQLLRAIESVAAGQSMFDARLMQLARRRISDDLSSARRGRGDDLSDQERRVMEKVVEGKTNRMIALELNLSEKTVKNYLSNAFQKMRVTRRAQAAVVFSRRRSFDTRL